MKYEKGFKQPPKKKSILRFCPRVQRRLLPGGLHVHPGPHSWYILPGQQNCMRELRFLPGCIGCAEHMRAGGVPAENGCEDHVIHRLSSGCSWCGLGPWRFDLVLRPCGQCAAEEHDEFAGLPFEVA